MEIIKYSLSIKTPVAKKKKEKKRERETEMSKTLKQPLFVYVFCRGVTLKVILSNS